MPRFPPMLLWSAGLASAVAVFRLIRREHRRVNDELQSLRGAGVADPAEPAGHPTLKRDPQTGIYRL
jgi:hypothetical protein